MSEIIRSEVNRPGYLWRTLDCDDQIPDLELAAILVNRGPIP